MILKVFSVFDSGVEAYLPPLLYKSKGEFIRAFTEAVNDPKSNLCKYAHQYVAFELGSWDDATCKFTLLASPLSIGVGVEFKNGQAEGVRPDAMSAGAGAAPQ